jgi:predicted membrane-bound mannosyltransferase
MWLLQEEGPILVLAVVGACLALFEPRKSRFAIFAGAWAFGLLLAYSLIKYKTPWLVLSFIVPLCIAAGYAVQAVGRVGGTWLSAVFAGAALAVCLWQSVVVNFFRYDDDRYPYVYSHTQREALELVRQVERLRDRLRERTRADRPPRVTIATPEYWPLPWYFQGIPGVAYEQRVSPSYDPLTVDAVIARESENPSEDQTAKLRTAVGANYQKVGTYPLRPGVKLALFVRRDLVE